MKIIRLATTDSTNRVALELLDEPAGTVVVAETQSAGRGRLARQWLSPPGTGLYFSVLLRPWLEPADLPKISLAAGLAVCLALEELAAITPQLKWPNDLLLADRKFGGILTESGPVRDKGETVVVVGIGVNLTTPPTAFPEELRARATTILAATGNELDREELLRAILSQLDKQIRRLELGEFSAILTEWKKRDVTLGRELDWVATDGKLVRGVSQGPDAAGLLSIRDHMGRVHTVLSGDLNLVV